LAPLKETTPVKEMFRRAARESGHPTMFAIAIAVGFAARLIVTLKLLLQN
jgi:hypothetical protein